MEHRSLNVLVLALSPDFFFSGSLAPFLGGAGALSPPRFLAELG